LSKRFTDAVKAVNYLLWPRRCGICGQYVTEETGHLCSLCWQRFGMAAASDYCPSCGTDVSQYAVINGKCPQCDDMSLCFDNIVRIGSYQDVLRDMILAIKHAERPELTELLGYQLYCAANSKLPLDQIELFVPVPLHWRRRLFRGYNQTSRIAQSFADHGLNVRNVLIRKKYTSPQPGLDYRQRAKNVRGAFKCASPHLINGATVCLIDDIKTSGATLSECARVLKSSGAAKVYAAVIAVAHQSKPS